MHDGSRELQHSTQISKLMQLHKSSQALTSLGQRSGKLMALIVELSKQCQSHAQRWWSAVTRGSLLAT